MNIGEAAHAAGVSAKMVRHYEAIGLLPPVQRGDNGYRRYDDAAVHTLRFIKRSRDLGFSMVEIAQLLGLWRDRKRSSADVKRMTLRHVQDLERRIAEMQSMKDTLAELASCCQGNARPECPILDRLAQTAKPR